MLTEAGETESKRYTLHSPRNWYTSVAAQLGWDTKAQTTLGRWGHNSLMPNHYNRQKGTIELSARNDVVDRVIAGWTPASEGPTIIQPPPAQTTHALRADHAHLGTRDRLALGKCSRWG